MTCTFERCTVPLSFVSYESHGKVTGEIVGIVAFDPFGSETFLLSIHA